MWKDPIVEEVRANRTKIAEKLGFDIRRIIADARSRQKLSGQPVVPPSRRQKKGS